MSHWLYQKRYQLILISIIIATCLKFLFYFQLMEVYGIMKLSLRYQAKVTLDDWEKGNSYEQYDDLFRYTQISCLALFKENCSKFHMSYILKWKENYLSLFSKNKSLCPTWRERLSPLDSRMFKVIRDYPPIIP